MDFFKEERATVEAVIDAVADAIPLMIADDENRFMNKVSVILNPPPKREPPADK